MPDISPAQLRTSFSPALHWHAETCQLPWRGLSDFLRLSWREWPRLPFTARIERAHSYRARSASKKVTWSLPLILLRPRVARARGSSQLPHPPFSASYLDPVQVHDIPYIKDSAPAQQPGPPESTPRRLCQQERGSGHREHHRNQCRWREGPVRPQQPDRDRNGALEDDRTGDITYCQPIFLPVKPEKTVRHLRQLGR